MTPDVLTPAQKHQLAEGIRRMEADGIPASEIKRLSQQWMDDQAVQPMRIPLGEIRDDVTKQPASPAALTAKSIPLPKKKAISYLPPAKPPALLPEPKPPVRGNNLLDVANYTLRLKAYEIELAKVRAENQRRLETALRNREAQQNTQAMREGKLAPPGKESDAQDVARIKAEQTDRARRTFDPVNTLQKQILPGLQQGAGRVADVGKIAESIKDPVAKRAYLQGMGMAVGAPGSVEEAVAFGAFAAGVRIAGPVIRAISAAAKKSEGAFESAISALKLTDDQTSRFRKQVEAVFKPKEVEGYAGGFAPNLKGMAQTETRYVRDNWQKVVKQDIVEMEGILKGDISANHRKKVTKALALAKESLNKGEIPVGVQKQLTKQFRETKPAGAPEAPKVIAEPKTAKAFNHETATIDDYLRDLKAGKAGSVQHQQFFANNAEKINARLKPKVETPKQATAVPTARPATKIEPDIEIPSGSTKTSHAVTDAERDFFGVKERRPTEVKHIEETIEQVKKDYASDAAQRLAKWGDRVNPLSYKQEVTLGFRKLELTRQLEEIDNLIAKNPTPELYGVRDQIKADFDEVATALDRSGSEAARTMRYRQATYQDDFSVLSVERKAAAMGASAKDLPKYKDLAEQYQKTGKELSQAEKELAKEKAGATLAKHKTGIWDKEELARERAELMKRFMSAPAGSLLTAEQLEVVGKLAVNLAKTGLQTMDDLVREIKKLAPGVTDDQIIDEFNKASAAPKTKKELSEELKELKSRYALIKRQGKYDEKLRTQIVEFENQLKTGNYALETKQRKEISDRVLLLRSHRDNLRKEIEFRLEQQGKSRARKFGEELSAFPKATLSTADMSAFLRQGLLLASGNPGKAIVALGRATRAMFDPKFAAKFDQELKSGPMAATRERAGLYLADQGVAIGKREEAFLSHVAEKVPIYGAIVRGSERHFNTYLNSLRADVFDTTYRMVGDMTIDEAKALANFINVGTGRGNIDHLGKFGGALQHVFFSPRLVAARIQAPADALGITKAGRQAWKSRGARRQMVQSWTSLLGAGIGTLKILEANGAKVNWDVESSDFGKAVIGNTRIDIWGGFQQPVRLLARIVKKTAETAAKANKGEEIKGQELLVDLGDDVLRFLRYKASPAVNIAVEQIAGKDAINQKIEGKTLPFGMGDTHWRTGSLIDSVTPLIAQDFLEAWRDPATPRERAIVGFLNSFFGVGISTYERSESKRK